MSVPPNPSALFGASALAFDPRQPGSCKPYETGPRLSSPLPRKPRTSSLSASPLEEASLSEPGLRKQCQLNRWNNQPHLPSCPHRPCNAGPCISGQQPIAINNFARVLVSPPASGLGGCGHLGAASKQLGKSSFEEAWANEASANDWLRLTDPSILQATLVKRREPQQGSS